MNREQLYQKTVDVLLDAYNKEELEHGRCDYCAVANICKEASVKTGMSVDSWSNLFTTSTLGQQYFYNKDGVQQQRGLKLIEATGYSVEELAKIEYAFETSIINTKKGYLYWRDVKTKQGQFIGLCAVLDVLKEIHEVEDVSHVENMHSLKEVKDKLMLKTI